MTRHAARDGTACNRRQDGLREVAPMTMNRFVHEQNMRHLRALLARTTDEADRQRIIGLIEEEEQRPRLEASSGNIRS